MNFENMPLEILLIIFSFVGKDGDNWAVLPQVCQQWKKICKKITIPFLKCDNRKYLVNSLNHFKGAKSIDLIELYDELIELEKPVTNRFFNNDILYISEMCPKLKELCLTECDFITDEGMEKIADNCPLLQSLELPCQCEHITDVTILNIAKKCKHLNSINLGHSHLFTNESLFSLAEYSKHLQSMRLFCTSISDEGITKIGEVCSKLKVFDIGFSDHITDVGILKVLEGCPLLEVLCIASCDITNASLLKIGECCPNLYDIDLRYCNDITDFGVSKMAKGCQKIKSINLSFCTEITDLGVINVGILCNQLKSMNLYGCKKVTKNSINKLKLYKKKRIILKYKMSSLIW